MTKQEFFNAMAVITDTRLSTLKFYTLRIWARVGEVEVTYTFENVTANESYRLGGLVFSAIGDQLRAGTARMFLDPQPLGFRRK